MPRKRGYKVDTITDIQSFVELVQGLEGTVWFRGHGKSNKYELKPTLYRTSAAKTYIELYNLEFEMIKKFRHRSIPFVGDRPNDDDLGTLFFMQHYNIPTRLLDWTENPSVALYFALHDPNNYDTKKGYIEDCCVWVINPIVWNNSALDIDIEYGILSYPQDDAMNGYIPIKSKDSNITRHKYPVGIEGRYNSPRIVAQRGTFMIYGTDTRKLEDLYLEERFPEDCLRKIVIPKTQIEAMRLSLYKMGITDSVIYPDLQGLAQEFRRQFGY